MITQNTALLGAYIRLAREARGWSLRDLATKAGVSHTSVDNIEKGYDPRTGRDTNITLDTLQKLALALNDSPDHLLACLIGTARVVLKKPVETWYEDMREDMERERGGVREYLRLKWGNGSIEFPTETNDAEQTAKHFLFPDVPPTMEEWQQVLRFAAFLRENK